MQDAGFIRIEYFGSNRWISLTESTRSKSFVQIYNFENLDFTASEIVITSYLLDKASFYVKAGLKELSLTDIVSKVLPTYLNTSLKTVKGTFTKLKTYSLISYYNEDDKNRVLTAVSDKEKNNLNLYLFTLGHKQHRINFFSKEARSVWNTCLVKMNLRNVDYR